MTERSIRTWPSEPQARVVSRAVLLTVAIALFSCFLGGSEKEANLSQYRRSSRSAPIPWTTISRRWNAVLSLLGSGLIERGIRTGDERARGDTETLPRSLP